MNPLRSVWVSAIVLTACLSTACRASSTKTASTIVPGGSLRLVPAMSSPRAAHTMTALDNGDVLIVGGFTDDEDRPAGAESFDARQERFSRIRQPQLLRQSHTATRLKDGKVLIAGGLLSGDRYTATAELYDPATKTFRSTGSMTVARAGHEAVLLDDGRVLMVGGIGAGWTFLSSAEIYDPRTGRFTGTGSMRESRAAHATAKLRDGRVLVMGGHRGRGAATTIHRTAEIYDPGTGRFSATGSMVVPRHKHDAVALDDGRSLVLGGSDNRDNEGMYSSVEIFDPGEGRFRMAPPMQISRFKLRGTALQVSNGAVLVAGGAAQVEQYDLASGKSVVFDRARDAAGQFAAAVAPLPGGRVLITGGYGGGRGPRSSAWIYDPAATPAPPSR